MDPGKRSKSSLGRKVKEVKPTNSQPAEPEAPLIQFPVIKQEDVARLLPRYTLVLSRNREDGVGMEDLDKIQQDFEKMLSTCAIRQRLLKSEVESISSVEEKKVKRGKDRPSVKRKRIEEKPKYKDARNVVKVIKNKHTPVNNFISDLPKYEIPKVIKPKHDVSDRFWISVDPYCQEVSKDNVIFLDELIKECSQEIDVKIPEIGNHYATEWTENSLQSEQSNGSLKPIKKNLDDKVVKQFINVYDKMKCGSEFALQSNNRIRNALCMDKPGILDTENTEDEILEEIQKFQKELALVNKHNLTELHKLQSVVSRDLQKQDVKTTLDKVDNQVMSLYNKILVVKQKHAASMKTETAYEKYLLPKPNLMEFEQEASSIIKQQVLLHRQLTDLTDFSLLE